MSKPNETTMIRAFTAAVKRIDKVAPKLEKDKGGSWSRAHVIDLALDALDRELSQPTETPAA